MLVILGIARERVYLNANLKPGKRVFGFWNRPYWELAGLLHDARACFRASIKAAHPDNGGNQADAAKISEAWSRAKRIFKAHGFELE